MRYPGASSSSQSRSGAARVELGDIMNVLTSVVDRMDAMETLPARQKADLPGRRLMPQGAEQSGRALRLDVGVPVSQAAAAAASLRTSALWMTQPSTIAPSTVQAMVAEQFDMGSGTSFNSASDDQLEAGAPALDTEYIEGRGRCALAGKRKPLAGLDVDSMSQQEMLSEFKRLRRRVRQHGGALG